ncbi:MAG: STAS/SEC14 domain-containing protein [Smithella sp.]|jgi:hypothetical protein
MEDKEKYHVSSSEKDGILEIIVTGEVTDRTYENVTNEVNAIIRAHKATKVIADFRAIEKRIEPSEMYRYFRNYNSALFEIQYAIVDLPDNIQYRNAAKDAGLTSLMWFTDIDAARKWIKKNACSYLDS